MGWRVTLKEAQQYYWEMHSIVQMHKLLVTVYDRCMYWKHITFVCENATMFSVDYYVHCMNITITYLLTHTKQSWLFSQQTVIINILKYICSYNISYTSILHVFTYGFLEL